MRYPSIIAHRCGGTLAPENTLAGLQKAARLGCWAVEFDVRITQDKIPVLIHDASVRRTTNGKGWVSKQNIDQLQLLDAGSKHNPLYAHERLPTLVDALALCQELNLWACIEIKTTQSNSEEAGQVVSKVIRQANWSQGFVSSFQEGALLAVRQYAPMLNTALLVERIPKDWHQRLTRLHASALHCQAKAGNSKYIAAVVAAKFPVSLFTVNTRAEAEHWLSLAEHNIGIFTDRPDLWSTAELNQRTL